jgi:hypothetical protein
MILEGGIVQVERIRSLNLMEANHFDCNSDRGIERKRRQFPRLPDKFVSDTAQETFMSDNACLLYLPARFDINSFCYLLFHVRTSVAADHCGLCLDQAVTEHDAVAKHNPIAEHNSVTQHDAVA